LFNLIKIMKNNILITNALTETWGNQDQKAILLGEWCKTLDNQKDLESRDYQQIPYHWSDRDKFIKDYDYLELFYERVLQSLAHNLNNYHEVDRSLRYWRMLLGPWLLTYVAIAWDRWESLRLAFAEQDFDEVCSLNLDRDLMVPKDYNIFNICNTLDHFNHDIFLEIIRYHYADQLSIYNLDQEDSIDVNIRSTLIKKTESTRSRTLRLLDKCFGLLQRHYKVVFVESFFDRVALFQVSRKLRQLPRIHNEFFQSINYPKVNQDRYHRSIDVQPTTDFEGFFQQHIFSQIPIAYLEGYAELNRVAGSIKTTGDVIFTANAHLDNDLFNCWAGDQVEKGKKLVASQHGGAIHLMQMFEHQERIAEAVTVWHKPYMNKHVQLTPNKLISGFRQSFFARYQTEKGTDLTLVGLETSRYTYRAQAGPFGRNYTEDYNQKITFAKSLSSTTYDLLRIRSFSRGDGWINSGLRYARDLGQDKISKYPTLREAFAHSKLIVSTYPQTTFIEAMHSNVPTILLYCEEHWPMHPQFDDLIEDLKTNNIIFTDPVKAAEHVNAVWNDPDQWWLDAETQKAVNHFFEMCGKVSDDWVDEWTDFFQSAYSQSIKTSSYIETSESDVGGSVVSKIKIFFVNFIKKSIQGLFIPLGRTRMGRVIIELVIKKY